MRIVADNHPTLVLNFERGEELLTTLSPFLAERSITACTLTGLGAADTLELAYYNLATREYERHQITEEVEILSLVGNLAWLDDKPILHIHGTFGRRDLATFGGHLFACRISGAGEIHLNILSGKMTRAFDPPTGLNLLCQAEL